MSFDTITGHNQQKKILLQTISSNRISHAYLFTGPEGVGKRLMAMAFVQRLLCITGDGCGQCSACQKVNNDNHPDLHFIDTDGATIKIDKVRALQKELSLRPLEGKYKICIIDGADLFNINAANALLKTLEEPQSGTVLILLSSQPQKLISTILSRCQQMPFSRLPKEQMATILRHKLDLDETAATILAALSDGSFTKALGSKQELFLKKRAKLIQSLSALSTGSTIPLFTFAAELKAEEESLIDILDIFRSFYRDILLLKNHQPETMLVNIDLLNLLKRELNTTTTSLMTKLKALEATNYHIQRNVNLSLALEIMLMRIVNA